MTDDVTHLRALLAEQTARAERAEAERDAALAANAEMRAALECAVDDLDGCLHGYDDNGRMDRQDEAGAEETLSDLRALLSRPGEAVPTFAIDPRTLVVL